MGGFIVKSITENLLLWEQRIKERIESGMKVEEWCEKNDISKYQYYYWHRRVRERQNVGEEIEFTDITPMISNIDSIRSMPVVPSSDFQVLFKGIQVTVPRDFNPESLAGLMKVLQTL